MSNPLKITRLDPQRIDHWKEQDEQRQHRAYRETGLGSWGQRTVADEYLQNNQAPMELAENVLPDDAFDVRSEPDGSAPRMRRPRRP